MSSLQGRSSDSGRLQSLEDASLDWLQMLRSGTAYDMDAGHAVDAKIQRAASWGACPAMPRRCDVMIRF